MARHVLIDTNILVAFSFQHDVNHSRAVQLLRQLDGAFLHVASPVLAEAFWLIAARVNYDRALSLVRYTVQNFTIENLMSADYTRMFDIMRRYRDAELDFTDAAIMALAERYAITEIATFDRRDFALVKPAHAEHFTLLP